MELKAGTEYAISLGIIQVLVRARRTVRGPVCPDGEKTASEEALKVSVATFSDAVRPSRAKILASIQPQSN